MALVKCDRVVCRDCEGDLQVIGKDSNGLVLVQCQRCDQKATCDVALSYFIELLVELLEAREK